ncbi:MAG: RNA 3'-terminal phosphate cyclase [Candidatus Nanohaloarchaea archaeon]
MLELDGSIGGGSVVRLSLGLSIATGTPFSLDRIRATREKPGLKHQHLAAVRAAAELSGAEVEGAELGSEKLRFSPGGEIEEAVRAEIPTAGSVGLLLQPLWIASIASEEGFSITVDGGATAGKWAPPVHYLENVAFPVMERHGIPATVDIRRHGFYPEGGALVRAGFGPPDCGGLEMVDQGEIDVVEGMSVASDHLRDAEVADRQREEARQVLKDARPSLDLDIETRYVGSSSPGSSIVLWSDTGRTVIGGDARGEQHRGYGQVRGERGKE